MKLADIVLYNHGRGPSDGNNYWRRVTVPHFIFVGVEAAVLGACIGLVSLAVTASYLTGWLGSDVLPAFMGDPLTALLNILPCVLLALLFYFATGRAWAAFLFPALIVYSLTLINCASFFFKWQALRPVSFASSLRALLDGVSGSEYSSLRDSFLRPCLLLMPASLAAGTALAALVTPGAMPGLPRLAGALVCAALCVLVLLTLVKSPSLYEEAHLTVQLSAGPQDLDYLSHGFIYPLLHEIVGG